MLTESSGSLNDVKMKRVFETAECEAVRNSIFWELRYEKHENQMKGRVVELRVRDLQMNVMQNNGASSYKMESRVI